MEKEESKSEVQLEQFAIAMSMGLGNLNIQTTKRGKSDLEYFGSDFEPNVQPINSCLNFAFGLNLMLLQTGATSPLLNACSHKTGLVLARSC